MDNVILIVVQKMLDLKTCEIQKKDAERLMETRYNDSLLSDQHYQSSIKNVNEHVLR